MLADLPKINLSQLGLENGYSKIVIVMEIGQDPNNVGPMMYPQPTNPPTKVSVRIEAKTSSPIASPELSGETKKAYEFVLGEGSALSVQAAIRDNLGLDHLTQI